MRPKVAGAGAALGIGCVAMIGMPVWPDAPLTAALGMMLAAGLIGAALGAVLAWALEDK